MFPTFAVGWQASVVREEEVGHFRKVASVSIVAVSESPAYETPVKSTILGNFYNPIGFSAVRLMQWQPGALSARHNGGYIPQFSSLLYNTRHSVLPLMQHSWIQAQWQPYIAVNNVYGLNQGEWQPLP